MHPPGFKYLGPFSPASTLQNPPCALLPADVIALQHDIAYSTARSWRDILSADIVAAIRLFWNGCWALIAAGLLTCKLLLEQVLLGTIIYPLCFFDKMGMLNSILLCVCISWIALLEMRLYNFVNPRAEHRCVEKSTWDSLLCLLDEQARQRR